MANCLVLSNKSAIFALPNSYGLIAKYISNYAIRRIPAIHSFGSVAVWRQKGIRPLFTYLTKLFLAKCQTAKQKVSKRIAVTCTPTSSRRNRLQSSNPQQRQSIIATLPSNTGDRAGISRLWLRLSPTSPRPIRSLSAAQLPPAVSTQYRTAARQYASKALSRLTTHLWLSGRQWLTLWTTSTPTSTRYTFISA